MKARDAYGLGIALMLAAPVFAQGFPPLRLADEGDVCYSWEGGHKSAGSFSKCQPAVNVVVLTPAAPPVVQAPAPMMMPMQSCPPPAEPERKRIIPHKPRPKVICKPA